MGGEPPQGRRQTPLRRKGAPMAEERPMKGAAAEAKTSPNPNIREREELLSQTSPHFSYLRGCLSNVQFALRISKMHN
jgi:hypothetical protein